MRKQRHRTLRKIMCFHTRQCVLMVTKVGLELLVQEDWLSTCTAGWYVNLDQDMGIAAGFTRIITSIPFLMQNCSCPHTLSRIDVKSKSCFQQISFKYFLCPAIFQGLGLQ